MKTNIHSPYRNTYPLIRMTLFRVIPGNMQSCDIIVIKRYKYASSGTNDDFPVAWIRGRQSGGSRFLERGIIANHEP